MRHTISIPSRQRGAALAVGLILLLVLTVLAVSGMNTASMELVMAGNEQYRQRAFHASETGIELALADLPSVPQTGAVMSVDRALTGDTESDVVTASQYMGDDLNLTGFSAGKFVGLHYQISSVGTSARNSQSQQFQGAYVIQNTGGSETFGSIIPPTGSTESGTSTGTETGSDTGGDDTGGDDDGDGTPQP
jgi:type IV pilus assembly protein PilX